MEASGFRPGVDVERDPAPNLPADQGLASLGLLMQLGGSIFLALNLLIAIMTMMAPGGRGSATFWLFAIGAAGAIRSGLHRAAGTTLAYSSAGGAALRAMKAYLIAAGLQTVFTLWALHELGMRGVTLTFAGALAAWPLTLLVVTLRPRIRAVLDDAVPVGPDFGLEGTGVLMALLGVIGVACGAFMTLLLMQVEGLVGTANGFIMILVCIALTVRSVLHAQAGVRGVTDPGSDRFHIAATRYTSVAVVTSIVAGAAMFIMMVQATLHPVGIITIAILVWMLLVWPLALKRFFGERSFAAVMAGDGQPVAFRRAPDAGMTALGWLLLAIAVQGLGFSIPVLLAGGPEAVTAEMMNDLMPMSFQAPTADKTGFHLQIGVSILQLWAALELVAMTPRWKSATLAYGLAGIAVTLYTSIPMLRNLDELRGMSRGLGGGGLPLPYLQIIGPIAIALAVPVGAILLALRKNAVSAAG